MLLFLVLLLCAEEEPRLGVNMKVFFTHLLLALVAPLVMQFELSSDGGGAVQCLLACCTQE